MKGNGHQGGGSNDEPKRRILLVDDEAAVLGPYRKALMAAGHSVATAHDGREANALLKAETFDVVVSDIHMPGMTGLDFLRCVRESDLDVPVVLMTGSPDLESATQAVEYGAFRYLTKPVANETLIDVVHAAIRLHVMARLKREALTIVGKAKHALGDRAGLEARFRNALERLWMAYQPIASFPERGLYGYEALVRTDEPELRSPLDLFDAAERLKKLPELGRTIRARVAKEWVHAPEHCKLFVNVHPQDLNDLELMSSAAPLSKIASRVVLEVTERASLDGVSGIQARIAKLRALGFGIALDDLGAGYAGLSWFTQLEPDVVKLDASLVRGIDASARKRAIVQSMLRLASRDLNMLVICEAVETPGERDALVGLGGNLMQGYLFGKPDPRFLPPSWVPV